jgi:hypothetical protein
MRKKYNITREQVDYLLSNIEDKDLVSAKLKAWFPKNVETFSSIRDILTSDSFVTDHIQAAQINYQEVNTANVLTSETTGLIVGNWYKSTSGSIYKYMGGNRAMGVTSMRYWFNNDGWGLHSEHERNSLVLATKEEIREVLIIQIKERGYERGNFACLRGLTDEAQKFSEDFDFSYDWVSDSLYSMPRGEGGCVMYQEGVFARLNPIEF